MKKKPQTFKEMMEAIDSLMEQHEFNKDKKDSLLIISCDDESSDCCIAGHSKELAMTLVMTMIKSEGVKNIVFAAHEAYLRHTVRNAAPSLEPLMKGIDKMLKDMKPNASAGPRLDVEFKPKKLS